MNSLRVKKISWLSFPPNKRSFRELGAFQVHTDILYKTERREREREREGKRLIGIKRKRI